MKHSFFLGAALTLVVGFSTACGGDSPADPPTPCTGDVALTATAKPVPEVAWSPLCGVARLSIFLPPSTGFLTTLWSISSPSGQIASGVRYGQVPPGAVEVTPAHPLQSGSTVAVGVIGVDGKVIGQTSVRIP